MRLYHAICKRRVRWDQSISKGLRWVLILGILLGDSSCDTQHSDPPQPKSAEKESRSFNLGPFNTHRFPGRPHNHPHPASFPPRSHPAHRGPLPVPISYSHKETPIQRPAQPPRDLQSAAQTLYDLRGFHIPLGGQEETQRYLRQQNQQQAPLVFPSFFQPQTPHHNIQDGRLSNSHNIQDVRLPNSQFQGGRNLLIQNDRNPAQFQDDRNNAHHQSLSIFGHNQHHQQTGRYPSPTSNELEFKPSQPDLGLSSTTENVFKPVARPLALPEKEPEAQQQLQQDPFIYVYEDDVDYEAETERSRKPTGLGTGHNQNNQIVIDPRIRTNTPTATLIPSPTTTGSPAEAQALLGNSFQPQRIESQEENPSPPFYHQNHNHDFADTLNHHRLQLPRGPKVDITPSSERKPPPDTSNAISPQILVEVKSERPGPVVYEEVQQAPKQQVGRPHRINRPDQFPQKFQPQFEEPALEPFFNFGNQRPRQQRPEPEPYNHNQFDHVLVQKLNPYLNRDPFRPPQRLRPVNTLVPQNYLSQNQFGDEHGNVLEEEPLPLEIETTTPTPTTTTTTTTEAPTTFQPEVIRAPSRLAPFSRSRMSPFGRSTTTTTTTTAPPTARRRIRPQLRRLTTSTTTTTTSTTTPTPTPEVIHLNEEYYDQNPNSVEELDEPVYYEPTPTPPVLIKQRGRLSPPRVPPTQSQPSPRQRIQFTQEQPFQQQQQQPSFNFNEQFQPNPGNPFQQNSGNQYQPNPFQSFNPNPPNPFQTFQHPNYIQQRDREPPQRGRKQPPKQPRNGKPLYVTGKMLEKEGGVYAGLGILPHYHNYGTPIPVPPPTRLPGLINYGNDRRQQQNEHNFLRQSIIRPHQREREPGPILVPTVRPKTLPTNKKAAFRNHLGRGREPTVAAREQAFAEREQAVSFREQAFNEREQAVASREQATRDQSAASRQQARENKREQAATTREQAREQHSASRELAREQARDQAVATRAEARERTREKLDLREQRADAGREEQAAAAREQARESKREHASTTREQQGAPRELAREQAAAVREGARERTREKIDLREQRADAGREEQAAAVRDQQEHAGTVRPRQRGRLPGGRRRKPQKTSLEDEEGVSEERTRPVVQPRPTATPRILQQYQEPLVTARERSRPLQNQPEYEETTLPNQEITTFRQQIVQQQQRQFEETLAPKPVRPVLVPAPTPTPTPSIEFSLPQTSKPNPLQRRPGAKRVRLSNFQVSTKRPQGPTQRPQGPTQRPQGPTPEPEERPAPSPPPRKLRPRARPPRPIAPTAQSSDDIQYVTQSSVKVFRKPTEAPGRFSSRYREESIGPTPGPTVPTTVIQAQASSPLPQAPFTSKPRATLRVPGAKNRPSTAPPKPFKVTPKASQESEKDALPASILLTPKDVLHNRKPARRIQPGSASARLKALQEKRRNLFKNRSGSGGGRPKPKPNVAPEPEYDEDEDEEDDDGEQSQSKREIQTVPKPEGPKVQNSAKATSAEKETGPPKPALSLPLLLRKSANASRAAAEPEADSEETAAILGIKLPTVDLSDEDGDFQLTWEQVSSSSTTTDSSRAGEPLTESESTLRGASVEAPIVDLKSSPELGSKKEFPRPHHLQAPTSSQSPFSIFTMSNQNPTLPLEAFFPIVSSAEKDRA